MANIHDFDDIRPFLPEELPEVYERLLADPEFQYALSVVYPGVPFEKLAQMIRQSGTSDEFQVTCIRPMLQMLIDKASDGMTADFSGITDRSKCYTFISNHRDIVLDSAFLCYCLIAEGIKTVEIAIGDNLLIRPWIKDLVRVNKSFIVQRALTMRQMLEASAKMSRYMHFAINEKKENIWIAQREGRAKDSNDRTQDSVLKMMAMGGEGSVIQRLKNLNIVPLSISYEYDPCDYLKAEEFQNKRDIEGFKKSKQDDLDNMKTGIFGYKGRIHYHAAPCINDWLDTIDPDTPKTEIFRLVAEHIDKQIHQGYVLYPCNYIAVDLLNGKGEYASEYTPEDKARFEAYLAKKMALIKLENKDEAYLRECILTMYANPALNKLGAEK
jgi:hypothetical protein